MYFNEGFLIREMRTRVAAAERSAALQLALKLGRSVPAPRRWAAGVLLGLAERLNPDLPRPVLPRPAAGYQRRSC